MQIKFKDGVIAELIDFSIDFSFKTRQATTAGPTLLARGPVSMDNEENRELVLRLAAEKEAKVLDPYMCCFKAIWMNDKNEPQYVEYTWRLKEQEVMLKTPLDLICDKAAKIDARVKEDFQSAKDIALPSLGSQEKKILS